MSDDLLLDVIARSIGRTITQENYSQRAADVLRSVKENDLTLPQPTNLIEHEITRLRADLAAVTAERDRLLRHIKIIAGQPLSSELDAGVKEGADYEGAYDSFINDARAILKGDN